VIKLFLSISARNDI